MQPIWQPHSSESLARRKKRTCCAINDEKLDDKYKAGIRWCTLAQLKDNVALSELEDLAVIKEQLHGMGQAHVAGHTACGMVMMVNVVEVEEVKEVVEMKSTYLHQI